MPLAAASSIGAPARLDALRRSKLLDSPPDETFDRLTRLATRLIGAPVSLISLVDTDRQFFKSAVGLSEPWASARETPLSHSFCQHVVASDAPLVVEDAREHPLVADNGAIQDLGVVAYAGIPLRTRDGQTLGSLCVTDDQPRRWTADELAVLTDLAGAAMTGIDLQTAAQEALEIADALDVERRQREALLDATAEGICGIDRDGRCTFVNLAASRLLGRSRDEMVGADLHQLIHHTRPDGRAYAAGDCPIIRAIQHGAPVHMQQELLWRADGSSFMADYSALPIVADGVVSGGVVTFVDLSERQAAQHLLSTQYSVARALSEASESEAGVTDALRVVGGLWDWEAALVWRHEASSDYLVVDSVWQRHIESTSIGAFMHASRAMRLQRDEGLIGQVWEMARAVMVPDIRAESRYLRGDLADTAGLGSVLVLPLRTENETVGVMELYARRQGPIDADVVEATTAIALQIGQYLVRKQTGQELVVARRAIAAATTGITITDTSRKDNPLVYVNAAFTDITGYEHDDVVGKNCRFLQGPDTDPAAVDEIRRAVREQRSCRVVLVNHRKDGTAFWNDLSISPVTAVDGRVTHFIGIQTDATDRIHNEERLSAATRDAELANAAKNIFLANVSHELRTPLNAVIGYSELLQEEVADLGVTELSPDLQKINVAGRHLLALINDVLDLAKIEAGRMELDLGPVDIPELVRDAAATVEPMMQERGNRFVVDCAVEGVIEADPTKLRQALLNLLANAAKFTENGEVTLRVERTDRNAGEIEFRVRDTGIGIADDDIQRLFAPFSQADASVAGKYGGTGLGLALTREVTLLMGGDVTVQSSPGVGSVFTIRIPYRRVGAGASPVERDPTPSYDRTLQAQTGRPTVLVIDDDPSVGRLLRKTLGPPYEVVTASTGAEGLIRAAEIHPLAIVLDVVMPTMTGWAVLAKLKADAELAEIPVILLTMVDDGRHGRLLGADEFMTKPLDRSRMRRVLDRYRTGMPNAKRALLVGCEPGSSEVSTTLEHDGWDVVMVDAAETALPLLSSHSPDVVLIDLAFCGAALPALLESLPEGADRPAVIALAPAELDAATQRALADGAATVIERSASSLAAVVRRIGSRAGAEPHSGKAAGAQERDGQQDDVESR